MSPPVSLYPIIIILAMIEVRNQWHWMVTIYIAGRVIFRPIPSTAPVNAFPQLSISCHVLAPSIQQGVSIRPTHNILQ